MILELHASVHEQRQYLIDIAPHLDEKGRTNNELKLKQLEEMQAYMNPEYVVDSEGLLTEASEKKYHDILNFVLQ